VVNYGNGNILNLTGNFRTLTVGLDCAEISLLDSHTERH